MNNLIFTCSRSRLERECLPVGRITIFTVLTKNYSDMNEIERIEHLEQSVNQLLVELSLIKSENTILRDMVFGIMKETLPAESVNNNLEIYISELKELNDKVFNDLKDFIIPTDKHSLLIKTKLAALSNYENLRSRYIAY